jgi:Putative transmembrane family 234
MMIGNVNSWLGLILVGILWGGTNPFIKKGSAGVQRVKASNLFFQILLELKYLFTQWRVMLIFNHFL